MATPPPGTQLIDPRQFSSVLRHYYDTAETSMLRHPAAVDGKLYEETSSYSDPALTDPGTLGQCAVRLWEAGALQLLTEPAQEYVDLFTVIKTDGPKGRRSRTV